MVRPKLPPRIPLRFLSLVGMLVAIGGVRPLAAQQIGTLTADRDWSMPAGTANLLTAEALWWRGQDALLPSRFSRESSVGSKTLGIGYRLTRLVLLDDATAVLSLVVTHETFGHGARAREFNWPTRYQFTAPPPYGAGSGVTISSLPDSLETPAIQMATFSMGGMESSNLAGRLLVHSWLDSGHASYHAMLRYLWSQLDAFEYLHNSSLGEGDDVDGYLAGLNTLRSARGKAPLRRKTLGSQSYIALANPLLWESVGVVIGSFLVGGKDSVSIPMLQLGSTRYLPYFRYVLTPFGPEIHSEHLVMHRRRITTLDLHGNVDGLSTSWGIDLEMSPLIRRPHWTVDARLAGWHQPQFTTVAGAATPTGAQLGASAALTGRWGGEAGPAIFAEVGYKSRGFLEGERLGGGPILRLGVSLW